MSQTNHAARPFVGLIAALSFIAAMACSSSTDATTSISASEADNVGASLSSDINASAVGLTVDNAATAGGAFASTSASLWTTAGCGVVSPMPPTDTDADGVPDSVTITYATPACHYAGPLGIDAVDVTGSLTLVDPTSTTADFSFKSSADNLKFAFTRAGIVSSATRNGTRLVVQNSNSLSQTNSMTTAFVKAGASVGTLTNTLVSSYTPGTGTSIVMGQPLPNGTYSLNGGLQWTTSTQTDAFVVTTVTPLAYDASCAATSASPFQSGEIHATVTSPGRNGVVRIVWSNCGEPQVTLMASANS